MRNHQRESLRGYSRLASQSLFPPDVEAVCGEIAIWLSALAAHLLAHNKTCCWICIPGFLFLCLRAKEEWDRCQCAYHALAGAKVSHADSAFKFGRWFAWPQAGVLHRNCELSW